MDALRVMNLDLRAPLRYKTRAGTALRIEAGGEAVAVYDGVDEEGTPLVPTVIADKDDLSGDFEIPAGRYLLVQIRSEVDDSSIRILADELKNEALWRDVGLAPRLYVRVLDEEDGGPVLQALRPVIDNGGGR
ncbi:MAG: hypothetical protein A2Z99_02890 [Treponema sp. GWB1_62_6]|nr:MAG: hypothetical protein A2Y36_12400 [Treponema sp. GWA1_62_8]OHE69653.1 MAG: hypothetical protein A2001_08835 [Treponema sp. GWC1_61_84]OHE70772.1 MAG: hypothetical protein A2413_10820 [Treponema sp. RIFOXYC1_FULL_61_9]OHE71336.1 MAG: hypothetical protein A2Z99_02890 [Treponema sp. GWB1_62_6]HCM25008.1 hypothetical protein [Treponema sp.]